jgi:hypothetical protein
MNKNALKLYFVCLNVDMTADRVKFAERFNSIASQLGYEGHGRQTNMARHYGVRQPSVKKWFDGGAMPDYEICKDLCVRARVHYEWLMTGRGPKSVDEYPISDPRIAHVLKVMEAMPEYKVDQAVKIIDTIAEPVPNGDTGSKAA